MNDLLKSIKRRQELDRQSSPLGERDMDILRAIISSVDGKGFPPSVRELAEVAGVRSPSTMHKILNRLERQGYLIREAGRSRAIRVVKP